MKDSYSFDVDEASAKKSYKLMYEAYSAIFNRLGVKSVSVRADSGNIGGSLSEEFHVLADSGEDALLVSETSDFAANMEVCPAVDVVPHVSLELELKPIEKFATPGLKKIETLSKALKIEPRELVKTMFYNCAEEGSKNLIPVCVILRGSDEVNPIKLKNILKLANPPQLLSDDEVKKVSGAYPGSCGPVGLKIPIYVEKGVEGLKNYVVGANEDSFHLKNVNHGRDFTPTSIADIRMAREGDKNPNGNGILKSFRGIEVGHIFYLGSKYSKAMNANFLSADGKSHPIEMGCYGIGVSRTVQAVIEQCNDKDGIIWPVSIAPFHVHICLLDPQDSALASYAQNLYESLNALGIECLMDDRDERPGVKFKDADLLGMPLRITMGKKGFDANQIEIVDRKTKEIVKLGKEQVLTNVQEWMEKSGWKSTKA